MDVFLYQAAFLCEDCGNAQRKHLDAAFKENGVEPVDADDESSFDSDRYPKGPYGDGGGEADTPQHCDQCGVFLDNPLTGDGENYVLDAFRDYVDVGSGNLEVLQEWRDRYSWMFDHLVEVTIPTWEDDKPLTAAQKKRLKELAG